MLYSPSKVSDPIIYRELLKISSVLEGLYQGKLSVLTVEPAHPRLGMLFICDGVHWNPLGDGVMRPIWFDGAVWKAFG